MSALLKAAQARADAENAQEYVDYARTKKLIIHKCFPSSKELYDGSSKLLDVDAWVRQASSNVNFLGAMAAQVDSFCQELITQEDGEYVKTVQDVAQFFGVDSSDFDTHVLKEKAALMNDQQCREALPLVINLLDGNVKKVFVAIEHRRCFLRKQAADKNVIAIYLEAAKELADKVDQLENTGKL